MKLLWLDKDGTLVAPKSGEKFVQQPLDQKPLPGTKEAITYYHNQGWKMAIISNQGGVASGYKSLEDAIAEMRYCLDLFPEIICTYFCPDFDGRYCWLVNRDAESPIHTAWGATWIGTFRKPNAGMIWAAILNYCGSQKPDECLMIGDRPEDEEAASNAGVNFIAADVWRSQFYIP